MIEALAMVGGIGVVGLAAAVVVMAFKIVSYASQQLDLRDLLDGEREQHRKTRGELAVETAAHVVTRAQLKAEQDLRSVAEARLNLAQRRVTELLRANLERATDEEVRAATAAAFAGFDGVPLSETADGRLLRPGEDA